MLGDGGELAPIDLREELPFSQNHLLWARNVPLSRLELRFARLVPRRATRIVLIDDNDGLVERAAAVLRAAGYDNLSYVDGGNAAWDRAGFVLFSGVHVPSKAFGEFIEHARGTPSVSASELDGLMRQRADMVVLDSRPFDEYSRVSIPRSTNVPGAELVLRVRDLAPSAATTIVVNCAGRTRSIIGAQSLIDAGVANRVVALRNGTMGWHLAGLPCDSGKAVRAPAVSGAALTWAQSGGGERRAQIRRSAHRPRHARKLARRRNAHAVPVRRARSGRIPGRPSARRALGARRAAGAGDRQLRRHARRSYRPERRQ